MVLTLPSVLTSERLTLPLWTADEVADIRAGRRRRQWHADFPREDDRGAAGLWTEGDTWGPRSIVRGATVLGSIGFYRPPAGDPAEAEIGYGLVGEAHGYGFATEALRTVLAATDALGVRVRAAVAPDNRASVRVLATSGFTELRGSDEDGNLVLARPLP